MGEMESILLKLYKEAKARRLVLNEEEFAKRIGISRATMFRYKKHPDKVDPETIKIAKEILETDNVSIKNPEAISLQHIIRIEAKCDVILSCMAEVMAAQKGSSVAKIINDQETLVSGQIAKKLKRF